MGAAPLELPTVESIWKAWQARSGSAAAPNAWGFEIQLTGHATRNGELLPRVATTDWEGGRRTWTTQDGERVDASSMLVFSEDGAKVAFEERTTVDGPGPSEPGLAVGPRLAGTPGVAWMPPSTPVVAGASAVAVLGGLLVSWALKGGKWFGGALLFSRVTDAAATHPARQALLQLIETFPGIHYKDIQRKSGQGGSATRHHLAKLVAAGHIKAVRTTGYTCYVPTRIGAPMAAAMPLLRAPGAKRLFAAAASAPGSAHGTLAKAAGVQPSTATYHLQRLTEAGLVSWEGGQVRLTAMGEDLKRMGAAA